MSKTRTVSIVSRDDRRLLLDTRRLIDELLETLDVLNSPEEMKDIEVAEREIKRGKGRPLSDFTESLNARK